MLLKLFLQKAGGGGKLRALKYITARQCCPNSRAKRGTNAFLFRSDADITLHVLPFSPARSLRANRPRTHLWDGEPRQSGKAPFFVKRRFSSVIPARRNVRGARKHEAGRSLRAARCCRRTLRRGGLPRAARMLCGRASRGRDRPSRASPGAGLWQRALPAGHKPTVG